MSGDEVAFCPAAFCPDPIVSICNRDAVDGPVKTVVMTDHQMPSASVSPEGIACYTQVDDLSETTQHADCVVD